MSYRTWTTVFILSFPLATAVKAEDIRDYDRLFESHTTLKVSVEAPFLMLTRERPDEEEASGKFRFEAEDGSDMEFDVAVRTRGKNRHDREICSFPPIRLNFKKSQTKGTLLDKQDKLKLVTHCENGSERYEQALLREYLAYRILNVLTERSFRVRLLRISYVFTDRDRQIETYAFFIEHSERLGKRIGAESVALERVAVGDIRPVNLNLASVFQYFLGNTDFSPIATAPGEDCCHNQALFAPQDGPYYTVPYDFDRTGWVNAPHAVPNPRFRLRSVRERLYRGRCVNNEHLATSLQLFRDRRADIEALIAEQAELEPATRRHLRNYSDQFYKIINNPRRVERNLVKSCK